MSEWKLVYEGWVPENEPLREALCALGNGYFVTRGAGEESSAGGARYPGTYAAGGYNRLRIAGRVTSIERAESAMSFRTSRGRTLPLLQSRSMCTTSGGSPDRGGMACGWIQGRQRHEAPGVSRPLECGEK